MKTPLTRRPWLLVGGLGVTLSVLLGSGLVAAVVDAGSSQGNGATSADFTGVRNLQLALTAPNNFNCENVTWMDSNVGPATVGSADLNNGYLNLSTFQRVCIRTRRAGRFKASIGVTQITETETDCSRVGMPEPSRDNDSCGTGPGELARVLQLGGRVDYVSGTATCPASSSNTYVPQALRYFDLDNGGTAMELCTIDDTNAVIAFTPNFKIDQHANDGSLTAAQTDRVQFNYTIRLDAS
jgi:hypothetical protein